MSEEECSLRPSAANASGTGLDPGNTQVLFVFLILLLSGGSQESERPEHNKDKRAAQAS